MDIFGISAVLLLLAVVFFLIGYGTFKVNPFIGMLAGIVALLVLAGVGLGALGVAVGFLTFLTTGWMLYVTVAAVFMAVGAGVGALW